MIGVFNMNNCKMNRDTEIRKLLQGHVRDLSDILDVSDSWKLLMNIIPRKLEKTNYNCDITRNNPARYNSAHFKNVVEVSERKGISSTELLLDDWGTCGRVRPAVGHLLYLLNKAELYKAAEYVSVDILGQKPSYTIKDDLITHSNNEELKGNRDEIEKLLDQINYPSSVIKEIEKYNVESKAFPPKVTIPPKIVISDSPEVEAKINNDGTYKIPGEVPKKDTEVSDMIKFSSNNVKSISSYENDIESGTVPAFSSLMQRDSSTQLLKQEVASTNNTASNSSSFNISDVIPVTVNPSENLPQLSGLMNTSTVFDESSMLPCISALNVNADENSLQGNNGKRTTENSTESTRKTSRNCVSPLPNLSLNTLLPHFNYADLLVATNNFNENPFVEGGNFLGSGAYGSVFLGKGLFDKLVAVKKLKLSNVDVVDVDDLVTKQFRNEVEVLSNYKHENLLSLLGYSCDGCTYCLVYEYVTGGALKTRLEANEANLDWKQRIRIALGTSKAVGYLHTAFSSPLIHRDIKSANILLDGDNNPKLCDFGLIKLISGQHTSSTTTAHGTSAYMSPEAFRGDISVKLDTFSFGVVLLELLTSLPPLDMNRDDSDLVTHVDSVCGEDNVIDPLLDKRAGSWKENDVDYANKIYLLAIKCLEDKKKRPTMVEMTKLLEELVSSMVTEN